MLYFLKKKYNEIFNKEIFLFANYHTSQPRFDQSGNYTQRLLCMIG